jgi:signal transduction histidine kinase
MPTAFAIIILFVGNILALVALLVTVFSRERIQKKLEETRRELTSKDQFNSLVVHELRTPLSLISGSTDTILRHKDLKPAVSRELVTSIKTSANSMLELVSDILDLAKIEAGKFTITKMPADLDLLLEETVDSFQPLAEEKGIKITFVKKSVPQVAMDEFRIRQVMNNLLSNAVKYTDTGEITVSVQEDGGSTEVLIKDTGRGIGEEELPTLFTRFTRGSSSKNSLGSGLGLVVVKNIVEAHGGKIKVESKKGVGSTFSFSIPTV